MFVLFLSWGLPFVVARVAAPCRLSVLAGVDGPLWYTKDSLLEVLKPLLS